MFSSYHGERCSYAGAVARLSIIYVLRAVSCCAGPGYWTSEDFYAQLVEESKCAVAEAAVLAISTTDFCLAAGIVYAGAEATCPAPAPY
jgi:hypothetical protein